MSPLRSAAIASWAQPDIFLVKFAPALEGVVTSWVGSCVAFLTVVLFLLAVVRDEVLMSLTFNTVSAVMLEVRMDVFQWTVAMRFCIVLVDGMAVLANMVVLVSMELLSMVAVGVELLVVGVELLVVVVVDVELAMVVVVDVEFVLAVVEVE